MLGAAVRLLAGNTRQMTHTKAKRGSKKPALGARSSTEMSVHPLLASIRAAAKPEGPPPTITAPPWVDPTAVAAAGDPVAVAELICSAVARPPPRRVALGVGRMAPQNPQRRARDTQGSNVRGIIVAMVDEECDRVSPRLNNTEIGFSML